MGGSQRRATAQGCACYHGQFDFFCALPMPDTLPLLTDGPPKAAPWRRPCASSCISIRGARTHNLKNIDLDIPRNQLVVITGAVGLGQVQPGV